MSEPTALLDKVLHLSTLIGQDMARFEKVSGLTGPRIHLLWVLGASGPSSQRDLAEALGVTPRNVTGLVDGLVASGHVTREPHPSDRRAFRVTPTEAGAQAIKDMVDSHAQLAGDLFGGIPDRRLEAFEATLDQTIATFARLMAEVTQ